jgi:hypothetical protein
MANNHELVSKGFRSLLAALAPYVSAMLAQRVQRKLVGYGFYGKVALRTKARSALCREQGKLFR